MKKRLYREKRWLKGKYCEKKLSVIEIADLCESNKTTIYDWIYYFELIRKKVLPKRSKSRYSLNERYFKNIDSGNKAYWLGFLAADGCVSNNPGNRFFCIELSKSKK